MNGPIDLSRRRLLTAAAALPLAAVPFGALAGRMPLWELARLHPVRFLGGLMFDIAYVVVVDVASDYGSEWVKGQIEELRHGDSGPAVAAALPRALPAPPSGETRFSHPVYKVSVVRMGIADWQEHERRQIALLLKDPAQRARFETLRDYLKDEKIRVMLADGEYSQPVTSDTSADDIATLDYLTIDEDKKPLHYKNLIDATGVGVFDRWYV